MKFTTHQIAIAGVLSALTIAMGLSPVGGFIPVPTPAGNATTMHIPTILAGIIEGPVVGGMVGLIFGIFSFWRAQTQVNPVARMMFTDPIVAVLPRVLIGIMAYYASAPFTRRNRKSVVGPAAGAIAGTITNTGGVLGLSVARGYLTPSIAWGIAALQGVGEVLAAVFLTVVIYQSVIRILRTRREERC